MADDRERGGSAADPRAEERTKERTEEDESGFRIRLPPITLPDFFPEDFEPNFRPAERVRLAGASPETKLLAVALIDIVDAALVLAGVGGALPALVAALLGAVFLGRAGLLQLWELFALAVAPAGAVPTLTLLALLQLRGEFDLLGRGHPEHVEGDAERERQPEQGDE